MLRHAVPGAPHGLVWMTSTCSALLVVVYVIASNLEAQIGRPYFFPC